MKTELPVIYKEQGKTYQADTCQALVRAAEEGQVRLEALSHDNYPGRALLNSTLPSLSSVGFWDAVGQQNWGLDLHRNEGVEFAFLETGNLHFTVENKQYTLQPNDLTITRPWQPHGLGLPHISASRLHWVMLDPGVRRPNQPWKWPKWIVLTEKDLCELATFLRQNEEPVWKANAEVRDCFQQIGQLVEADRFGSNISRITVYLNELLVLVLDMLRDNHIKLDPSLSSTAHTVELFLDDLRKNLAQPWTVASMAERCGLGVTRFVHHCKQSTNMTPAQYLNHSRIEAAAHMLVEKPKISITDISLSCGFSSSQYFATMFRRHLGCSPSAFRARHLSLSDPQNRHCQ
jgi:AraC family 4-hydroxyphenylacetate 3-monooxygenase operon regulatory protein